MKIILIVSMLILSSCSRSVASSKYALNCESVAPELQRCENQEVICYITNAGAISCIQKGIIASLQEAR